MKLFTPSFFRSALRSSVLVFLTLFAASAAFAERPAGASREEYFRHSPASLLQASANPVRIIRDEYGVPHVFAKNENDLFFGYGYVTAEDRLFQIEMLRRSVQGRVSEVMGEKFLELDKVALRDGYSVEEVAARVAAAPPRQQKLLEMFARGVNKRIAEVRRDADAMPVEFAEYKFKPSEWTASDVASVFIGTMAVRYSDFTSEMDNLNLANYLREKFGNDSARKIFNDIVPVDPVDCPTTVISAHNGETGAEADGVGFIDKTGNFGALVNAGEIPGGLAASGYPLERSRLKKSLRELGLPSKLGSYFYSVSRAKSKNGTSLLAAGPQMGFFNPAYLFEVGLHSPEYSVSGTTTPCYMNVMFGMNSDIAFAATAGVGNITDVYSEKLDPKDRSRYLFNGKYRKFEKRNFSIKVRGKKRPVRVEFLRSVHGPVFEIDDRKGVAYSKRRAWEFAEIETMFAWMDAAGASNLDDFRKAASKVAVSINLFASDRAGNILFYMAGRYPVRPDGIDDRLPQPGDGTAEWLGFSDPMGNPCCVNPSCGFFANWNSRPDVKFRNGDLSTGWGPDQRTRVIQDFVSERGRLGLDDLMEINKKIGYTDVRAHIFLPRLIENMRSSMKFSPSGTVEAALATLAAWDAQRRDDDGNGFYDSPAVALFDALWPEMMNGIFGDELAANVRLIDSDPTWTQSGPLYYQLAGRLEKNRLNFDYTSGRGAAAAVKDAVLSACAKLAGEYGTNDQKKWLKKSDALIFDSLNFAGIPQTSADNKISTDIVNRGTENHFVELGPKTTLAYNVNPPGQSAFRSRNVQKNSPHLRDQMPMFEGYKGYKPMLWSIGEILAKKTAEKFIIAD